jgi:hypothetical protein
MKEVLIAIQDGKKPNLPAPSDSKGKAALLNRDRNWLNVFGLGHKNKKD